MTEQGGTGMGFGDNGGVTANSSLVSTSIWMWDARTVGMDTLSMVGNWEWGLRRVGEVRECLELSLLQSFYGGRGAIRDAFDGKPLGVLG